MSVCLYKSSFLKKSLSLLVLITFGLTSGIAPSFAQLPPVGQMFSLTSGYEPPILRGMTVHAENPLLFDFIVDRGQDMMADGPLKAESEKLIKYFLASMTIPDKDAWVNLSPFEKNRIIPEALGQTEMGKTMLEQDYTLKQLAASLTNPDTELGKEYWAKVGNGRDRSLQDLSKVWIVPDGATVVEKDGFAYITESKLDVKMEEDYKNRSLVPGSWSLERKQQPGTRNQPPGTLQQAPGTNHQGPATEVFRSLILPKLIKEVNEGKTFAPTRQVYQSVILASWYKKALKDSLLGKIYADKSKIEGITTDEKDIKQKVYDQYLEAFKKGVYNVIKEEEAGEETVPRKYFSGGEGFDNVANSTAVFHDRTRWKNAEREIMALSASSQIVQIGVNAVESLEEANEVAKTVSSAVYRGEIKNTAWTESVAYPPNAWVIARSGEKSGNHTVIDVGPGFDSDAVAVQLQANSQPGVNDLMSPHSVALAGFADVIAVRQDGGTISSIEMALAEEVGEANKESIIKKRGSMNIVAAARMGESARKTIIDTVKEFLQLAGTQNLDINQKTRLWTAPLNHLARKDHIQSVIRKLNLVINPNFLKAVSLMRQQLGLSQDDFMFIDIIPGTLGDFVQEFLNLNEVKTALEQAHIMIGKIHAPGLEYTLLDDETENPDLRSKQNPLFWMIGVHQTPATDSGMRLPGTTESLTYIAQRNDSQVKMLGYKLAKDLFQKYAATPEQLQQVINAYEEFHKRAVIEGRSLLSIESLPGSFRDLAYEISQAMPQGNTDEEIARMLPDFVSLSEKILRTGSRFVDRFNSLVKGSRQWFFNMQFYDKYFARDVLLIGPVLRVAMDSLKYHHTLKALKEKQEAYSQLTSGHPLFVVALESLKSAVLSAVQKQGLKPESLINYFENGLPEAMSGYYPDDPHYDDLIKLIEEYIASLSEDSKPTPRHSPIARQAYIAFMEGVTKFNTSKFGRMTDQEFFDTTGMAKTYLLYFLAPQMVSASSGTILTGEQDHPASENKAVSGVVSSNSRDLGGIDFDPSKLNLQIKRDGHGVPLPLPQQDVEHINIKGLFPVILNIGPVNVKTLPLLGKIESHPEMALSDG